MTREEQYLKTMIETLKVEKNSNKNELLTILRSSLIIFNQTGAYGNKSNYYKEYVELRVPIPMLVKAKDFHEEFAKLSSEIYVEPKDMVQDYEYAGLRIKPKLIEIETNEEKEHDVVFDEIKNIIIQGIRGAKYTIWVAVAWFTDRTIYDELLLRKKEGVNIRVITSDEETNRYLIKDLEEQFEVVKIKLNGNNRFHDKFCIIDLEYVMHGSYNWSKNATSNDETWATAIDKDFVRKFADEFINLINENK